MNEFYGFENLECWKQAKDLAVDIYRLQDDGHFTDDYGLLNDLRQSATSVASLIAGGRERGGASEFIRYLSKAKSTAALLRTQLVISRDIGYLAEGDYLDFDDKINRITAMVGGLIKAIRNKSRGSGAGSGKGAGAGAGSGSKTDSSKSSGSGKSSSTNTGPNSIKSKDFETGSKDFKAKSQSINPNFKNKETKTALQPDVFP
jgi:four helix bundle protein